MKMICWAVLSGALLAACAGPDGHDHAEEKQAEAEHGHAAGDIVFTAAQAKAAGVAVETVAPAPMAASFKAAGRIATPVSGETVVAATSAGIVSLAPAIGAEGTPVARGTVVARISSRHLPDGDPVEKLRVAYETARSAYERAEKLAADHIVSPAQLEQLRAQHEAARIAYEAQAESASAGGISVAAPGAGYVKQVLVQPGAYVSVGQPLLTLAATRRLQLRVDVPERYASRLAAVTTARFRTSGGETVYDLRELRGRLVARGRTTEGSPYIPLTFEFDNRGGIPAGASAEVWLLEAEKPSRLSVPLSALTEEQGVYYVYLQAEAEAYRKQEVALGGSDGERVEIVRGLRGGEKVVVAGATQVRLAAFSGALPEGHSHEH